MNQENFVDVKSRLQMIDKKGQIVISKELRQAAGLEYGTYVFLKPLGDGKIMVQSIGTPSEVICRLENSS